MHTHFDRDWQPKAVHESLADAATVLVCAPPFAGGAESVVPKLVSERATDGSTALVWVTLSDSQSGVERRLSEHDLLEALAAVGVVTTDAGAESSADVRVASVDGPGNLTTLGVRVTALVDDFAECDHVVCCVDSLSTLLQYADVRAVFKFSHVLCGRLATADGHTYLVINPEVHEPMTVTRFATLADAALDVTDEGLRLRAPGR